MIANDGQLSEIILLLKALLMIQIKDKFSNDQKEINKADVARFLHSIGFPPSDIALLLGKKNATEIAPYLYTKKKKQVENG